MSDQLNTQKESFFQKHRKKFLVLLSLLIILTAILLAIFLPKESESSSEIDSGGSGGEISAITENTYGMFVFTLVDDQNNGLIVPIMISGSQSENNRELPENSWFVPGIIKGIKPIIDGNSFSVNLSDTVKSQIQSISFIKSDDNTYLAPSVGNVKEANQYNFITMGEINTNSLKLFEIGTGISDDLKQFRMVNSGITTFNELKTVVEDNLKFNQKI